MTPTTKLEAINTLLATIGESPVNSLTSGLIEANCLHVDTIHARMSSDTDLVQRGMKMYDRIKNTYAIGVAVEVDIVVLLDFEEMPETARRYVAIRAARVLQDRVLGSESLHSFNARDEQVAWNNLLQNESDQVHGLVEHSLL